jgi:hypothetical protein
MSAPETAGGLPVVSRHMSVADGLLAVADGLMFAADGLMFAANDLVPAPDDFMWAGDDYMYVADDYMPAGDGFMQAQPRHTPYPQTFHHIELAKSDLLFHSMLIAEVDTVFLPGDWRRGVRSWRGHYVGG